MFNSRTIVYSCKILFSNMDGVTKDVILNSLLKKGKYLKLDNIIKIAKKLLVSIMMNLLI